MTKIAMGASVLHNFTLVHDDFDESYFLDDDDNDGDNDDDVHDRNCRTKVSASNKHNCWLIKKTFCPAHGGTWDFK